MFHRGFKHSKTIKALGLRPRAFISFLVFEIPMKHSHSFLKYYFTLPQPSTRHKFALRTYLILRGVEPMWRLGDWQGSKCKCNVNVNVLGVFVEDKKFDSKLVRFNLHIRRLQRNAFVYISEKISTSVLLSWYVCSYIKTNSLFQYQTRKSLWAVWYFFFQNAPREIIM